MLQLCVEGSMSLFHNVSRDVGNAQLSCAFGPSRSQAVPEAARGFFVPQADLHWRSNTSEIGKVGQELSVL